MKSLKSGLKLALALFMVFCLMTECHARQAEENSVVSFFDGAELQIETPDQVQELQRALQDMLELPEDELRERRYADYQMNEGKWTLAEILSAYFLQEKPIDLDRIYSDASENAAKTVIKERLEALKSLEFD